MRETRESNTWVPIVAGVLGLLAVGIAVRQCGSNPAPESAGPQLAASGRLPERARGGWSAQSQRRSGDGEAAYSQPGRGRPADGRATGALERGSEPSDFAPPRRGSGRDAAERDYRDTDTVDVGGDAIPAPPRLPPGVAAGASGPGVAGGGVTDVAGNSAAKPAAVPDAAAKPGSDKAGTVPQTEQVATANDPAKADVANDGGPVLSLPLDTSTEPDKGGDSAPIIANGVTFDANGAHFSADAQLFIPSDNVNPAAGTLTFWIKPDWAGDVESKFQILHLGATTWANRLDIFKDLAYLRLLMCPDSGFESGAGANISGWKKGDSHLITGTWGDGVVAMYIDGVSVGASEYQGELDIGPSPPFFLGSGNPRVKEGANSNITGFAVYARALDPDEVAALYAQPPP